MFLNQSLMFDYQRDGFVLLRGLFNRVEVEAMLDAVSSGGRITDATRVRSDAEGNSTKLALWHHLDDPTTDIWAAASTAPRIVNNVRMLLTEEAAFFHGKVMLKEAHTGGAWEWHQDYGYWYDQGYVYPRMLSAFVALDPATVENGCLQVLRGSHLLGRLNHTQIGSQTGVESTRIRPLEGMFEAVQCEMEPGDVLFFHCNLLHRSASNDSDHPRRSFIMCYNALGNPQMAEEQTYEHRPVPVSADDTIEANFATSKR